MGVITDPTQSPLLDLVSSVYRTAVPQMIAEVLSRPALKYTDGKTLTYCCNVRVLGLNAIIYDVPIAAGNNMLYTLDVGAAVVVTRSGLPFAGRLEITDYSKMKPGKLVSVPVDLKRRVAAPPVDEGIRIVTLTFGDLADPLYGGYGIVPLGAKAIWQGTTLIGVTA